MNDLRTPREMRHQAAIEAIPESERTWEQQRALAGYWAISNYRATAMGDR